MLNMQYKSFVWPNNPKTYTLSCERRTVVQKIPMGGFEVQDLGATCMVLRGEGEFFGPDAMRNFSLLVQTFRQDGAGTLLHPAWQGTQACFTQLQLTQEPREDYVAYRFEFCESAPQQELKTAYVTRRRGRGGKIYYTVRSGETLWHVCSKYELSMAELLEMNPGLSSPTRLTLGQKVRVQ